MVLFHLSRVLVWRLRKITPTPRETKALDNVGINSQVIRSYMVWRRSMLVVALPSLLFSMIVGIVNLAMTDSIFDDLNAFGMIAASMPYVAPTTLCIGAVVALAYWKQLRKSTKATFIGFMVSIVMPIWPALFPADVKVDGVENTISVGIGYALSYAIELLPLLVTIPSGIVRGALRIRGLIPESSLAGWVIVFITPFSSLLTFAALIVICQVLGDMLLATGATILVLTPMWFFFRRRLYTGAMLVEEAENKLDRNQLIIGILNLIGVGFVVAWAVTWSVEIEEEDGFKKLGILGEDDDDEDEISLFTYAQGARLVFEWIGRGFMSTLCFADVILRMTIKNWRADRNRRRDDDEQIDAMFQTMEEIVSGTKHKTEDEVKPSTSSVPYGREPTADDDMLEHQEPPSFTTQDPVPLEPQSDEERKKKIEDDIVFYSSMRQQALSQRLEAEAADWHEATMARRAELDDMNQKKMP